jgi:hypothetical protein
LIVLMFFCRFCYWCLLSAALAVSVAAALAAALSLALSLLVAAALSLLTLALAPSAATSHLRRLGSG